MHRLPRLSDSSPSSRLRTWIATLALLAIAVLGCQPAADPLDAVREQQAAGDFAGTIEPLRTLLSEQPLSPEANYLYGRALLYTGKGTLATWAFREAMKDPDWRVQAGLEIARAELANTDFNEVVEITTQLLEHDPELTVALLYRAQAQAHWRKDPEAALEDAERVLEREPEMIEAYEPRILSLIYLERLKEAAEVLAEAGERLEALDAAPGNLAWHCSTTAILATDLGETERAGETWSRCLEKYPDDWNVVVNAVRFYETNGEWNRSVEILRSALAAAPEQRVFRTALAERLRATGSPAEGEALLREATEVEDPRQAAAAWSDLALYRHALSEHGAAADALTRAVERIREVEEANPQLLFRLADALVVSGQLDRARQVADEITVTAQREMIRGRVAQEKGHPAQALEHFDEALRLWPNNAFARYYAALAAEGLGDFDRALEEYRYSIRIEVGATDARTRGAKLLIASGQPLVAYQLIFLEVAKAPLDPEGQLVSMYLMGRVANPKQLQGELKTLATRDPARLPEALARGARGAAETSGPAAALGLLRGAPGIDYRDPGSAPALRELVRLAHASGLPDVAERVTAAALAARPKAAVFHEIRGLHLQLGGAAGAAEAYERAVALDPTNAAALAGLGRLALAREPAAAVTLFDRAAAADPSDPVPKLEAARALRAAGKLEAASRRIDALLVAHPFEGEAAAEQVSLDLERNAVAPRTLERARRFLRFGGGPAAYEQLSTVHAQLGQAEEAEEAARRAQVLREAEPRPAPEPAPAPEPTPG